MPPVLITQAFALAQRHHQAGELTEAEALYRQILAVSPEHADALHFLGLVASQTGRPDVAVELMRRSIAINPRASVYHDNLGSVLRAMGRIEEAIACSQRALALDPNEAVSHNNLGNALRDQRRLAEAIGCYDRALLLRPDYVEAVSNRGTALRETGQLKESLLAYQRALKLAPAYVDAHLGLGNTLADLGAAREADTAYRRALELRPDRADVHSALLLNLHYLPEIPDNVMSAAHRGWGEAHARLAPQATKAHSNLPVPERRLRIGYVSPDFRNHPVAFFVEGLLAMHDRVQVEVFCYANVRQPDAVTARLRQYADHWRGIVGLSDVQIATLIAEDQIDVLVDLAGHTADHRLLVFAHRSAPVQVTYLGYCDTTGLPAIDYRITDAQADPPGTAAHLHTERLVRLSQCAWCYSPHADAPSVAEAPALKSGVITFGSFNALAKLNDDVLNLWAEVLLRVPNSRLLLKSIGLEEELARARIYERFAHCGVARERIELSGPTPSRLAHLDAYRRMDVALDPFPYNGTTTTCEALWMGVPVVTLEGSRHAARVGASLLRTVGLVELVTRDRSDYVEALVRLSRDVPALAQLRATLRDRVKGSPLLDASSFARKMETAYREMWRAWCASPLS